MSSNEIFLNNINELKIKYKEEIIEFRSFEKLMIKTFFDILNNQDRKVLFIGIEKDLVSILLIIITAIKQYVDNMENPENSILDTINNGDKVFYNGRICIFDKVDIDERYNRKYIYLLEKDNSKTFVPYENAHLLTLYNGQANRINKINGIYQRHNITKEFISELMKKETKKLNGVVKESTIIVFQHKEELYNLIDSIEIIFKNKYYAISQMFPLAYYTALESYEWFKGNRIKENAVIKFVSNINTAIDIIRDDEKIKNIVLIGERTYRDSIETELREAGMTNSIKKIVVVDTWESNFDFSLLLTDEEPFNTYAITKEVILDNINLYDQFLLDLKSSLQKKNYNLIGNMINKNIDIFEVDSAEVLNKNIFYINRNLKILFDYSYGNIKILEFIKLSYYLCNKIEQSILPLSKCDNNLNDINCKVDILKETVELFPKERTEYKLMYDIISQIKEILNILELENFKLETIKEKVIDNTRLSLLAIKNVDEFSTLEDHFRTLIKNNLDIEKIDNKIGIYGRESLIIPCFFKNKYFNFINTNLVKNIKIIVYRREKNRLKALIKRNNQMLAAIFKSNKLSDDEEFQFDKINEHLYNKSNFINDENSNNEEETFNDIEDNIQKIIQENRINLIINEGKYRKGISHSVIKVSRIITFDDNDYSFLSENYQANVIDRNNNDIKQKDISELSIGDELIFTRSKVKGEEDIVKVVIKELLNNKEFNDDYGKYFELNKLWKDSLIDYMKKYDVTEVGISNMFLIHAKQITPIAIANWLNGNIIGPKDLNDIRIIAEIVDDNILYEKLDEIIDACRQERRVQIQVRKSIAKLIINSIVNNDENNNHIHNIVKSTIGDLDRYAYIGMISSIQNINEEVGAQYVNKVIERDE